MSMLLILTKKIVESVAIVIQGATTILKAEGALKWIGQRITAIVTLQQHGTILRMAAMERAMVTTLI